MLFPSVSTRTQDRLLRAVLLASALALFCGCGDETMIAPCSEGTTRNCTMPDGRPGQQVCSLGAWASCSAAESCSEGTRRDCTLSGGGPGEQSCRDGVWGDCQEKTGPCTEGATVACTQSDGKPGQRICEDGAWTACSPLPGQCEEGTYKACTTSEGAEGARACIDYQWGECEPLGCADGETQTCSTACGTGTEICVKGEWKNCTAPTPENEICDGVDNDCNGQVDENCLCVHGTSEPCYDDTEQTINQGPCRAGVRVCNRGQWGECLNQVLPESEICTDTIDNDCDGVVNNGCTCFPGESRPCGSSTGECSQGTHTCTAEAQWGPCLDAVGPAPETDFGCDGLDNNCDGLVDNGLPVDADEANNTCASARSYTLNDQDAADTVLTLTLYPEGDVDYFRIIATEEPGVVTIPPCCPWPFCDPPDPQCNTLQAELVSPNVSGLQYQLSLLTGSCSSPTQTFSDTQGVDVQWAGACGLDDSNSFWIKVAPAQSSSPTYSCQPYTVRLRYRNVPGACQ